VKEQNSQDTKKGHHTIFAHELQQIKTLTPIAYGQSVSGYDR